MKNRKLRIPLLLLVLMLVVSGEIIYQSTVSAEAAVKKQTGYVRKNGNWYYYRRGRKIKGWYLNSRGVKYYFGKTGVAKGGIQTIRGKKYLFSSKGRMYRNRFYKKSGTTYYFRSNGTMAKGRLKVKGSWYAFDRRTGQMIVNNFYKETNGSCYYASSDGRLFRNKWITRNGVHYYASADGLLIQDQQQDQQSEISLWWPLSFKYSCISSYFGNRSSPGGIGSTNHQGIDIPAPTGTPIYAAASGTIASMLSPSASGGAGYYIKIDHDGTDISTEYMHQSRFNPKLKVGDKVSKGDIIGYVGSTGNSTGPHLHFGVRVKGINQNPLNYVKKPS